MSYARLLYSSLITAILVVFIVLCFDVYDSASSLTNSNFNNITTTYGQVQFYRSAQHISRLFHVVIQDVLIDAKNNCVYGEQEEGFHKVLQNQHKSPVVKIYDEIVKVKCADQAFFENNYQKTHNMMNSGLAFGICLCIVDVFIVSIIWIFCTGWCTFSSIKKQKEESYQLISNQV
ncbi:Hypothetical_protein [Hexamita inflata]|uniref:Hypothetical_protein n=1 Tax=Hexamita inflata TaxID=28002 RepID=A0AA86PQ75_9EUKA|nr:Hypothetical protein HINF_LOCUS26767 [Hexamita inflata]